MDNLFTEALKNSQPFLVEIIKRRNEKAMLIKKQKEQQEKDHQDWLERNRMNKNKLLNFGKKEKIKDMLKILNGIPPHNSGGNICYGDGYFNRTIPGKEGNKEYDTAMEELITEFGPVSTWSRFMAKVWR